MRVLVTGGAGFIGSHVVDKLCDLGHSVTVIDDLSTGSRSNLDSSQARHQDLRVHVADIVDPATADLVRDARPEVMLLLAAQMSVKVSMRDPLLDARTNVDGMIRMLEAARTSGCRKVVFASSGGTIYAPSEDSAAPTIESHPRVPRSFYGLTKSMAGDYLRLYWEHYGLDYVSLALGNAYGPRQSPFGEAGVVAIFAKRMLTGQPCTINGNGLTTRDFVHVSDVADAFVRAMTRGHGLTNVGTARGVSVLEIYRILAEATGYDEQPLHGEPLPGEIQRVCLDFSKAHRELGWTPQVGLQQGIRSVIEWMAGTASDHAAPDVAGTGLR
jgi:UDP-glucose 4-epimerase